MLTMTIISNYYSFVNGNACFLHKILKKDEILLKNHIKQQTIQSIAMQWIPAILAAIFIYMVPPVGIAIIIAYFTAPILLAIRSMTKLPLTISTFFVMLSILFIFSYVFSFIALQGLMDTVPLLEKHLSDLPVKQI